MIPPVLIAIVLAVIFSQGLKIALIMFAHGQRFAWADLVVTGGMPSSHSAIVVALTLAIGLTEGMSNLFILCLVLTAIVIRDALGVRRTAGEEGKLLNKIIAMTRLKVKPLHYSLGHTPLEVTVGVIIGIISGLIVLWL